MSIPPFKPNRTQDSEARWAAVENYLSQLHLHVGRQATVAAQQAVQQNVTATEEGSGDTGGDGGSFSGDATTLQGEAIDDTSPVDGDLLHYQAATEEWQPSQVLDGKYGIRTGSAATAYLHLGAGTTAAQTAPLKFASGASMTAAEQGAWEYDGQRFYVTPTSNRNQLVMSRGVDIATTTVANTVTRTNVFVGEILATSAVAGSVYIGHLYGRYSTVNGTDTFTFTVQMGIAGDILSFTSPAGMVTNAPVAIRFIVTFRAVGGSGEIWGFIEAYVNGTAIHVPDVAVSSADTTNTMNMRFDVEWSAADAANSFSSDQAFLIEMD